jgi:hypothetical protein
MHSDERLLTETIEQAMAIYSETRPRTADERADALRELRCYLPLLIKHNIADPICLTGKALRHLRELEHRPRPASRRKTSANAPVAAAADFAAL